jgi:hypothetical protein
MKERNQVMTKQNWKSQKEEASGQTKYVGY